MLERAEESQPPEKTAHSQQVLMFSSEEHIEVAYHLKNIGRQAEYGLSLEYFKNISPRECLAIATPLPLDAGSWSTV